MYLSDIIINVGWLFLGAYSSVGQSSGLASMVELVDTTVLRSVAHPGMEVRVFLGALVFIIQPNNPKVAGSSPARPT